MKRDLHTNTPADAAAHSRRETPQWSRYDVAEEAGYDPGPDYPVPEHLKLAADDPWMVALRKSIAEVNLLSAREMYAAAIQHGRGMERAEERVRAAEADVVAAGGGL